MKICKRCKEEKEDSEYRIIQIKYLCSFCKDCEKIINLEYYHKNKKSKPFKEKRDNLREIWMDNNWDSMLLSKIKARASKKNLEFSLTKDDLKFPEYCPVLGLKLERNKGTGIPNSNSPSVDRIDSTKGYTKDNIQLISYRANVLKNNATIEELEAILKYMKENLNDTN